MVHREYTCDASTWGEQDWWPEEGWTPLCIGGYYSNNSTAHPYRLYVSGTNVVMYVRYHGDSASYELDVRCWVLCVHTG